MYDNHVYNNQLYPCITVHGMRLRNVYFLSTSMRIPFPGLSSNTDLMVIPYNLAKLGGSYSPLICALGHIYGQCYIAP